MPRKRVVSAAAAAAAEAAWEDLQHRSDWPGKNPGPTCPGCGQSDQIVQVEDHCYRGVENERVVTVDLWCDRCTAWVVALPGIVCGGGMYCKSWHWEYVGHRWMLITDAPETPGAGPGRRARRKKEVAT